MTSVDARRFRRRASTDQRSTATKLFPYAAAASMWIVPTLSGEIGDAITAVVTGRPTLSSWDTAVQRFRSGGGDQIASELAQQHAHP